MLISRRNMLKRTAFLAGASALSPMLLNLQAQASASAALMPKRFVFLVRSNGLRPYGIDPVGIADRMETAGKKLHESLYTDTLTEMKLHEDLNVLEAFKPKLNIVQGLSATMNVGAHTGSYGALGAFRCAEAESPTGATIDALLAEAFPSIFSHLGLAMDAPGKHIMNPRISSAGANNPLSFYADPMGAYKDLFGSVLGGEKIKKQIAMDQSLLDFVKDDIRRVEKELPGSEREKLGHYLGAYESMRERETKIQERADAIKRGAPKADDKYTSELGVDRLEAHMDMAAAALITGLSNVVTVRMDHLGHHYKGLGMGTESLHGYGHNETDPGRHKNNDGITGVEGIRRVRRCHMEMMAGLAQKLEDVPEGGGTMLDNTLIVMLSESGGAHHCNFGSFPFITLGGLGGTLKTGQYIQYPVGRNAGNSDRRSITNFYHSLLHAVGKPQEFGTRDNSLLADIDQTAPLPELMA